MNRYNWISIEDRLPEKGTDVLVYCGDMMNVCTYLGSDIDIVIAE